MICFALNQVNSECSVAFFKITLTLIYYVFDLLISLSFEFPVHMKALFAQSHVFVLHYPNQTFVTQCMVFALEMMETRHGITQFISLLQQAGTNIAGSVDYLSPNTEVATIRPIERASLTLKIKQPP